MQPFNTFNSRLNGTDGERQRGVPSFVLMAVLCVLNAWQIATLYPVYLENFQ